MSIDECHELFQHPRYGKQAADLAVRLIKRGRKYGIILLLATQSPTKDSIPKEITRNVSCGVAFAVADHVANDGLLGAGKYRAGVRATELRMKTDRGTCVAVGVTDNVFELVRTFYVPLEDGADLVTPVVARAVAHRAERGHALTTMDTHREIEAAPVDHLADIHRAIGDEPRVRTQTVLARLVALNPAEYEPWTARDLRAVLEKHGVPSRKSDGAMVVRADDVADAITRCDDRDEAREAAGNQGVFPASSLTRTPSSDQGEQSSGRQTGAFRGTPAHRRKSESADTVPGSLPDVGGGGGHGD